MKMDKLIMGLVDSGILRIFIINKYLINTLNFFILVEFLWYSLYLEDFFQPHNFIIWKEISAKNLTYKDTH